MKYGMKKIRNTEATSQHEHCGALGEDEKTGKH